MAASGEWHCEKRAFSKNESFASDNEKRVSDKGFSQSNDVHIFGYSRTKLSDDDLRERIRGYLPRGNEVSSTVSDFLHLIKYVSGAYDSSEGFQELDNAIYEHEVSKKSIEGSCRRLFYLALPPSVYPQVCKLIKGYCMNKSDLGGWTRVVVEKPFGKDLGSAEELSTQIGELFEEPQIYCIDHYLGKELVQNLLVLRFANRFFLPLWNRDNIANVQIVFRENFGTEGRGGYFDQYGIIRDINQNHLLQVFCLIAMEKPVSMNPEHIRDEKVKVLQCVNPIIDRDVVLGQYRGYKDDPTVPDDSKHSDFCNGVPFILKAGKALNSRKTEIRVQFKDVPGDIFKCSKQGRNEFVIRLQPSEAMYMKLTVKQPGLEMITIQSELDLSYRQRCVGLYKCVGCLGDFHTPSSPDRRGGSGAFTIRTRQSGACRGRRAARKGWLRADAWLHMDFFNPCD